MTRRLKADEMGAFKDQCVVNYDKATSKLNDIIGKNPNISKRYRDYINEKNRIAAATDIQNLMYATNGTLPEDITNVSGQLGAFNPSVPMSLAPGFADYQNLSLMSNRMKVSEKYSQTPELFLSFEEKGMIKYSDSERDFLKRWQQRDKTQKEKIDKIKSQEEYMILREELDKICKSSEMQEFINNANIKKVYEDWAPKPYQIECRVIDSLYNDQIMRDYSRAYILASELTHNKSLREGGANVINDIKNDYFKQQVVALKSRYEELARQNEEAVKKVIAPASNVEGLTDGKAIVEKMIEPYKGKIVYMDVWGTWCQPCINAIKASPAMKEAVKDYDIVYLYFTYGSEEAAWKGCIAELGLTKPNYVHYRLPQNQQEAVVSYLKVDGYPFYVLFDKQGNMEILDRGHIGNIQGFKNKIDELSKK